MRVAVKKNQIFTNEKFKETEGFLQLAQEKLHLNGHANTEWLELSLRAAIQKDASGLLESLLNDPKIQVCGDEKLPGEKLMSNQSKEVECLFGKITLKRNYYYNTVKGSGRYPLDDALGLLDGYSPGMLRLMCRAGAQDSYEVSSEDLKAYANLEVNARQINRIVDQIGPDMRSKLEKEKLPARAKAVPRLYVSCDGTGVPMRKKEVENTKGKQPDGSAKTKEVKIGCIFTQHPVDQEEPFRDCDSTSYIATMRRCGDFGGLLRKEAFRRGMGLAEEVVFIADGATWIWELARVNFPGALEILDYYHAHEYLSDIVNLLYGKQSAAGSKQLELWKQALFEDEIETIITQARSYASKMTCEEELVNNKINYFENNKHRMKYGTYKTMGYFYGSGVIEAGCKTVVGKRAKQSGMFWSTPGVENVLAIRTALYSNRFDNYWDQRNAA